ncbi:MAG: hypothetical protein J0H99_11755, partial [Rhodospirillales bacterium]|nr:hypothetical protein [Rhodospirillales bacterium]
QCQMETIKYLEFLENRGHLTFNHSPVEGKRPKHTLFKLIKMGMKIGHPDLDIYIGHPPRMLILEFKTMTGVISKAQQKRANLLGALGFDHRFIIAESSSDCVNQVARILREDYGIKDAQ